MKQTDALAMMGLSQAEASALSTKLADAEALIDPKTLALFASFEGTVMAEGKDNHAGHDMHGAHKDHWK